MASGDDSLQLLVVLSLTHHTRNACVHGKKRRLFGTHARNTCVTEIRLLPRPYHYLLMCPGSVRNGSEQKCRGREAHP